MTNATEINQTKINKLIQNSPKGLVLLSSELVSKGYSYELQQRYRKGGWLKSIGKGAMLKSGDPFMLFGALSALQSQSSVNIHIGGRSALELQGSTHYLQLSFPKTTLFVPTNRIATMVYQNKWDSDYKVYKINLFNNDMLGFDIYRDGDIKMNISNPARAMLECWH